MNLFQPLTLYALLVVASFFLHLFKMVQQFTATDPPGTAADYFRKNVWANLASVTSMVIGFLVIWWRIPDTITAEGIAAAIGLGYVPDSFIKRFLPSGAK